MTLTRGQHKQLADIIGNIASAWFIAGIISPVFSKLSISEAATYALLGLIMTGFFTYVSLGLAEGKRYD
jgi:hypothetical protein